MEIPFLSLANQNGSLKGDILQALENIIDKNWYILGENVNLFEKKYSEFNQTKHTIGVANGLDAIKIALLSLNIKQGDEVIVPSNTFIATWLAVSSVGAIIVPVEPDIETYNISPALIENAITSKTKAIIPVHLYGQACNMDEIIRIAKQNDLYIIEDNAQAQGAKYNGKITGSIGDINATSFYPGKNLGAMGDGGAITTNDNELAERARIIRNYGASKKYHHETIGFNSRLDEMQAAVLNVKLGYLDEWTKERQQIADRYKKQLKNVGDLVFPTVTPGATHVYHLFVVRTAHRDKLNAFLSAKGIGTLIHYPIPAHLQNAYKELGYKKGDFPIAENLSDTILSLPLYPGLTEEQIIYICDQIKAFYNFRL